MSFRSKVGGKLLSLGSYTLSAAPVDAAGNRGAAVTRRFKLTR